MPKATKCCICWTLFSGLLRWIACMLLLAFIWPKSSSNMLLNKSMTYYTLGVTFVYWNGVADFNQIWREKTTDPNLLYVVEKMHQIFRNCRLIFVIVKHRSSSYKLFPCFLYCKGQICFLFFFFIFFLQSCPSCLRSYLCIVLFYALD